MKTYKQYRAEGLAALKGNWSNALVATILVSIIYCAFYFPYIWFYLNVNEEVAYADPVSFLKTFLLVIGVLAVGCYLFIYPLYVGYYKAFRNLNAENDGEILRNTFRETFNSWGRNIWGMFLMYLFISLWSLLFIIPGLIKTFSYALTPYILKDYPELSANQAINLSRKMMKGHKLDYFCLCLTFIGWIILTVFTLGIGLIWLMPYMSSTSAAFYLDVKAEYEAKQALS